MFALSYRHGLSIVSLWLELRLLGKAQVATLFMRGLAIARPLTDSIPFYPGFFNSLILFFSPSSFRPRFPSSALTALSLFFDFSRRRRNEKVG